MTPDTQSFPTLPHRGGPPRAVRWLSGLVAAMLALAGALLATSTPAAAASLGPGFSSDAGFFVGAYVTDGRQVYCIDIGAGSPFGDTGPAHTVTSLDGVSADSLAKINYVLTTWGQFADPGGDCGRGDVHLVAG